MNHTVITEFVLLGLSDDPDLQIVIFLFLFITYVLLLETYYHPNLGGLRSYFFLRNFSFSEISFTTVCSRFLGQLLPKIRLFPRIIVQPNYFSLFSWG